MKGKTKNGKANLPREIGKQEARRVFGSLPAMTGEYLSRATRARVRTHRVRVRARVWRHTRVNERVCISSDSY